MPQAGHSQAVAPSPPPQQQQLGRQVSWQTEWPQVSTTGRHSSLRQAGLSQAKCRGRQAPGLAGGGSGPASSGSGEAPPDCRSSAAGAGGLGRRVGRGLPPGCPAKCTHGWRGEACHHRGPRHTFSLLPARCIPLGQLARKEAVQLGADGRQVRVLGSADRAGGRRVRRHGLVQAPEAVDVPAGRVHCRLVEKIQASGAAPLLLPQNHGSCSRQRRHLRQGRQRRQRRLHLGGAAWLLTCKPTQTCSRGCLQGRGQRSLWVSCVPSEPQAYPQPTTPDEHFQVTYRRP